MYLHAEMLEKMHIKKTVGEENSDCVSVGDPDERWIALVYAELRKTALVNSALAEYCLLSGGSFSC